MKVYEIEIELTGIEPRIWRKVIIEETATLEMLHLTIQGAMGWLNYHVHDFHHGGEIYDEFTESTLVVSDILRKGSAFEYHYDMGDGWVHLLKVTTIREHTRFDTYQKCIAGERACPPEDCGGVPGYEELCQALKDESHPEHKSMKQWAGAFDPEVFSITQASAMISALLALS